MKKTITFKSIALSLLLAMPLIMNAQQPKAFGRTIAQNPDKETGLIRCASTEYEQYLQEKNQDRATTEQFESWLGNKIAERRIARKNQKSGNAVLTIPVVVHIIHNGQTIGTGPNIKDGQVLSQIKVLNQDYSKQEGTPGYNDDPVGANTGIQFCLAQVDPNGEATNGIIRHDMGQVSWSESDIELMLKPQTQWDPTKYLNIWVCNFGGDLNGTLGYAQFPSNSTLTGIPQTGFAETDGVIIGYKYFGSKDIFPGGTYDASYGRGRTTTHEVGHFLGLRHIWGDGTNSCSSSDYCDDTPYAANANGGCPIGMDSCPNKSGEDMINNYMDYTNDTCMNIFTLDQTERMITTLENATRRASLLTSGVCGLATTADFESLRETTIYPNPAQNELNISVADGNLPDSFVIYNSLGQTVANVKVGNESALKVNTSDYSAGIYIITIFKGGESKTLKFIKN